MSGPYAFSDSAELRVEALKLAVKFYEDSVDTDTDDVIEAAGEFLEFILKPE